MRHNFSEVPSTSIPRSSFNRDHGYKTTFNADYLIPFLVDEALPGDTFSVRVNAFCRMATPIYPLMDNMFLDFFYFEVPLRQIWDNSRKFFGEQDNPGDSIDYTVPQMVSTATTGYAEQSIFDYLGLPTKVPDLTHSALFTRAFKHIWNEWFKDQNIHNDVTVETDDGPDDPADSGNLKRTKRFDYFTSCLPWPQKGDSVALPLGTVAPVTGIGKQTQVWTSGSATAYETGASASTAYTSFQSIDPRTTDQNFWAEEDPNNTGYPNIYADLSNATAATINQLRQSFQIQRLLEKDARAGTRYEEIVLSHFQVQGLDKRATRPVYLGGGSVPIMVTPVEQTSSTDVTSPQGNLAARAQAFAQNGFTRSFTEHSIIIGIVNVRADITYQQGLDRMWSRSTRYDFYWPSLAHIGEQSVLQKEIWADPATRANDDVVFGYNERYSEYKYKPSKITGRFRSNCTTPLDSWHLSEEFASAPTLNAGFIEPQTPMSRVKAVTTEPDFIFDSFIQMRCARPMPLYSVPGLIDHF